MKFKACLKLLLFLALAVRSTWGQTPLDTILPDTRLRDPHVLVDQGSKTYYLISSIARPAGSGIGVSVFTSKDLQTWKGPTSVYETPKGYWGYGSIWAPEMHQYKGKYYLFNTYNTKDSIYAQWADWPPRIRRGTAILWSDSSTGPFQAFHNHSQTPEDQMALDGTLWVENGIPYMVYCHEWVQIRDGTVEVVRLKDDLSEAVGTSQVLFKGSDAPYIDSVQPSYVTDGPYPYRTRTGKLVMIWSSFKANKYVLILARSKTGSILGPWEQMKDLVYENDGGHGVIFQRLDGALMLALHQPNSVAERERLFYLEDTGDAIKISATAHVYPVTGIGTGKLRVAKAPENTRVTSSWTWGQAFNEVRTLLGKLVRSPH